MYEVTAALWRGRERPPANVLNLVERHLRNSHQVFSPRLERPPGSEIVGPTFYVTAGDPFSAGATGLLAIRDVLSAVNKTAVVRLVDPLDLVVNFRQGVPRLGGPR